MASAARLVLHLGLHKTATTSLQELVFPRLSRPAIYLGKTRWTMALRASDDIEVLLRSLCSGDISVERLSSSQLQISLELLLDRWISVALAAKRQDEQLADAGVPGSGVNPQGLSPA